MSISKNKKIFLFLFAFVLIFYADSFSHYFFQDDWWHFYISNANSIEEILEFFNPINKYGYQIFRPLSTQLVFFTFNKLFGYNHYIFQLLALLLLSINSYLIFKLTRKGVDFSIPLLISIYYIVHHQNIGIVYYLSTIQTSIAVLFTLLSLINIKNKQKNWKFKTILYCILGVLSHEIVIFNPIIIAFILGTKNKKSFNNYKNFIMLLIALSITFLAFRFKFINSNFFENTHYNISLNIKTILNNLMWYVLWLFSFPEYVINFIGSGFKPLPQLFGVFKTKSITSFIVLIINSIIYFWLLIKSKFSKLIIHNIFFFVISLLPVLLFPWHKYTYYLPVASIFIMLGINNSLIKIKKKKLFLKIGLTILIICATTTNIIDRQTSSSYSRGEMSATISKNVNLDQLRFGRKTVYVANDPNFKVFAKEWGSTSTQAKIVLRNDLFFKLLSKNNDLVVIYQDNLEGVPPPNYDFLIEIKENW